MGGLKWTGPLACRSPFAVMFVDKCHLLCFRVSKLPCDRLLIPNKSLTLKNSQFQQQVRILTLVLKVLVWKTFLLSPKSKLIVLSSKKFPRNVLHTGNLLHRYILLRLGQKSLRKKVEHNYVHITLLCPMCEYLKKCFSVLSKKIITHHLNKPVFI